MVKLSAFGDSVLRGVVFENNCYKYSKECFVNLLKADLCADIENKGKFGATISVGENAVSKNAENIKNTTAEYVVMEFGGNDCDFNWKEISENPLEMHKPKTQIEDFVKIYTEAIDKIKAMGKIPVMLSLPPIDAEKYFSRISKGLNAGNILKWLSGNIRFITDWHERYNIETFKIAIMNSIPIIDITSKFLENRNYTRFLCADGIHPNAAGHKIIASAIKEHMENKGIVLGNC